MVVENRQFCKPKYRTFERSARGCRERQFLRARTISISNTVSMTEQDLERDNEFPKTVRQRNWESCGFCRRPLRLDDIASTAVHAIDQRLPLYDLQVLQSVVVQVCEFGRILLKRSISELPTDSSCA